MRRFNVTEHCNPQTDYMVDISEKIAQIEIMVDAGDYFTINRARQFGKTTTLDRLGVALADRYLCISIDFEGYGSAVLATEPAFCAFFVDLVASRLKATSEGRSLLEAWCDSKPETFADLSKAVSGLCAEHKVVLMIDEVDKAGNNRVFLDFLGMLRSKYRQRKRGWDTTFHSVILAGVHDIKNLKLRMVRSGSQQPEEGEGLYNSPWNIAAAFDVDLSFNPAEIATMLREYEEDHHTGMDIVAVAAELYSYTAGYPFLVSRLCKIIDERLQREWSLLGVREAVKLILEEKNTLFDDLSKNLENNAELYRAVYEVLIVGDGKSFAIDDPMVDLGVMYGYFINVNGKVAISNRIFEIRMSNYFVSKDERKRAQCASILQSDLVAGGRFNMELCLRKFAEHYLEMYANDNEEDRRFLERHGRLIFLSYLKPLLNGQGFYHMESQLTDLRRMDLVVDFGREQFIIELKLWKGEAEHTKAYEQLVGYLESRKMKIGYLLTFDFRKDTKRNPKAEWVEFDGKRIFDVIM